MNPLLLDPVLVPKPWGGRRLASLGADLPDDGRGYGEAWVVADLDPAATPQRDPASRIRNGPAAGATLADLLADDAESLLGPVATHEGRFPLLVKLLDADQHLSVQVHPPAAVVADHAGARLKAESWVVVAAEPDAVLFLGLVDGVTRPQVHDALGTTALVPLLRRVPAHAGDVFHVPAGMVHALGAGVVVAEVQTPSDTTWRLWDWTDTYDRPDRDLHVGPGWEAIAASWETNTTTPEPAPQDGRLVTTEHYRIDRVTVTAGDLVDPAPGLPVVVSVLAGHLRVGDEVLGPGEVVVVPASCDRPPVADTDGIVLATVPVGDAT